MNDYNELIAKCAYWINIGHESGRDFDITKFIEECRDAIEQLEKERDELVTKLHQLEKERDALLSDIPATCGDCAHEDDEEWCERGCRWEWRGVRSEENVR